MRDKKLENAQIALAAFQRHLDFIKEVKSRGIDAVLAEWEEKVRKQIIRVERLKIDEYTTSLAMQKVQTDLGKRA